MKAVLWFFSMSSEWCVIGFAAAFLLSSFSRIPFRVRYALALVFAVGALYLFVATSILVHFFADRLIWAVMPAFGFTFALARIRFSDAG